MVFEGVAPYPSEQLSCNCGQSEPQSLECLTDCKALREWRHRHRQAPDISAHLDKYGAQLPSDVVTEVPEGHMATPELVKHLGCSAAVLFKRNKQGALKRGWKPSGLRLYRKESHWVTGQYPLIWMPVS